MVNVRVVGVSKRKDIGFRNAFGVYYVLSYSEVPAKICIGYDLQGKKENKDKK